MPYHIYIPWLRENYFTQIKNPKILEIGVDAGQSMLPIIQNFTFANLAFEYTGLDIKRDENLLIALSNFLKSAHQSVRYIIENSLEWLPKCNEQYDIILIDGDHNYQTVYEELKYIPKLLRSGGIVICDDYQNSQWSEKDLYYSTRDSHSNIDISTKPPPNGELKKVGVKAAVDDFLLENPGWTLSVGNDICEAVVIRRGN